MADYIDRQAAIHEIHKQVWLAETAKTFLTEALNELPSAQPEPIKINIDHELTKDEYEKLRKDLADAPVVLLPSAEPDIVRCKDCQYATRKYYTDGNYYCTRTSSYPWSSDGFCSDGVRREDE